MSRVARVTALLTLLLLAALAVGVAIATFGVVVALSLFCAGAALIGFEGVLHKQQ